MTTFRTATGEDLNATPSLPALLREAAETDAGAIAFSESERDLTYEEWSARVACGAGALAAAGVVPGDVVAILLPNGIEYAVAYLSILHAGAIATGINPRYGSREIEAIMAIAEPRLLITATPRADVSCISPETLAAGRAISEQPHRADEPAMIVFTSGTTGTAKGATYDAASIDAARTIEMSLDPSRYPQIEGSLPMQHVSFMTKIGAFLGRRARIVIPNGRWTAAGTLAAIERERLTHLSLVPAQLALMLRDPNLDSFDLSSLRAVTLGGAPAAPALIDEAEQRIGASVLVRYSCTEVSIATGTQIGERADGTAGRPLPGVEVRVRDDGEILLRSPAMMRGYWRQAPGTAGALDGDGFFATGDLGALDEAGRLRVHGRAGEMLLRGGYNIYPAEVEAALLEHPAVTMAAVVGYPDPVLGERSRALVVAGGLAPVSAADLTAFLRGRIADYKIPDQIEFRDSLPLTPSSKVDKRALRSE